MSHTPQTILDSILPVKECSDMTVVTRIRQIISQDMVTIAEQLIKEFPFWYDPVLTPSIGQVFWSENHYIMNVSSEFLLREMLGLAIPSDLTQRLQIFLDVKKCFGTAEWLSPVYLPFTITSLLNLYDFCENESIRNDCKLVLDRIATEVLSATCSFNGSIISPSGRAYARHRKNTKGLHLSLFIDFLLSGRNIVNPPDAPEMALRAALSDTTYRPSPSVYTNLDSLSNTTETSIKLSSHFDEITHYLEANNVSLDIFASILWSYGAYIPSGYANMGKIVAFMDTYNLFQHPHFKALAKTRKILGGRRRPSHFTRFIYLLSKCTIANDYSKGALLTNASMCVFKQGNVVMSSLIHYNDGLPSFQQWPFAINLNGVALWCAYGSVGGGGMSCLGNPEAGKELSTARLLPKITQSGNRLTAKYSSSSAWMYCSTLTLKPQMYWPVEQFDEHGQYGKWTWATKGSSVIAYKITGRTVQIVVSDMQVENSLLEDFLRLL